MKLLTFKQDFTLINTFSSILLLGESTFVKLEMRETRNTPKSPPQYLLEEVESYSPSVLTLKMLLLREETQKNKDDLAVVISRETILSSRDSKLQLGYDSIIQKFEYRQYTRMFFLISHGYIVTW